MTEQKDKQAEFEVDEKSGVHMVVKEKGGKVLADVIVGKSTGPGTMVRLERQERGLAGHGHFEVPVRQVARRLA